MSDQSPASPTSRIPGFYELTPAERRRRAERSAELPEGRLDGLAERLGLDAANLLVENVIGLFDLPFALATNFTIDGRDVLVPMVIEEPSVVAAASNAARMARAGGGFSTEADPPITIGQVELLDVPDVPAAIRAIEDATAELLSVGNAGAGRLVELGGGCRDIETRELPGGGHLVVHLLVDCRDAMGANTVNAMAEALAPRLADLAGGRFGLRILSNLADRRLARAWCRIPCAALARRTSSGEAVRDGVVSATRFAELDPYRAATHNKGIMNGVDALLVATANDWRSAEAGAHGYAARSGRYLPLSRWFVDDRGDLEGRIELPMAVATRGGATRVHPAAALARQILGTKRATDLARIAAAVGLAQNLAALAAMAAEGIQAGHMALHDRSRPRAERDDNPPEST